MASVSFVGFQENVEIPEGFQRLEISETLHSSKSKDELFSLLSDPHKLTLWMGSVEKFDSRPGGKLRFTNGKQATCTSFQLGKSVSFISDEFGNFTAEVVKTNDGNSIQISFAILTDEGEFKSKEIIELIEKLKENL